MHAERLAAYLSRQLGEQVRVTSLVQAFPGLSRETWLVRIERAAAGHDEGLVLRADPPGGPFVPVPLHYEFRVAGTARNPLAVALPDGAPVAAHDMATYRAHAQPFFTQLDLLGASQIALLGNLPE